MSETYSGAERREFLRYGYEKPVRYKVVSSPNSKNATSKFVDALSKNLSASGILFTTNVLPEISSILTLELDYRTTRICQEIEGRALILKDKLLGKVVRIEDNEDGRFSVGVAFITKTENITEGVKKLIK